MGRHKRYYLTTVQLTFDETEKIAEFNVMRTPEKEYELHNDLYMNMEIPTMRNIPATMEYTPYHIREEDSGIQKCEVFFAHQTKNGNIDVINELKGVIMWHLIKDYKYHVTQAEENLDNLIKSLKEQ